jgi:hypothetical protein
MQVLTYQQVRVWCEEHNITILPDGQLQRPEAMRSHIRLELPHEAHRVPWFAKDLVDLAFSDSPEDLLLWVCEWRIWSEEIESIAVEHFRRLRCTYKHDARLEEYPAQIFGASEVNGAVMFTIFPLLFSWDAYLVGASSAPTVFISHDEFVEIEVSNAVAEARAMEHLKAWKPTIRESSLPG